MSRSTVEDFDFLSRLGSGSFGEVFKVLRLTDNNVYVIKIVRIGELTQKEKGEAINEVRLLAHIDSAFIVRYHDSFIDKESLHIVMEFCNRGDLNILLRKAREKEVQSLKEDLTWSISLQIILGLYCLHKQKILHRDLKTANVFLQKDPSQRYFAVKVGDLGVAKLLETSTAFAQTIVGTPYYLSPELCADQPYRDRSDCWALGIILYECCTLSRPFTAGNQCALILKIIQAQVEPVPESHASDELSALISWLLQKDWRDRPSVREILLEQFICDKLHEHGLDLPEELLDEPKSHNLTLRADALYRSGHGHDNSNSNSNSGNEVEETEFGARDRDQINYPVLPHQSSVETKAQRRPGTNPESKRGVSHSNPISSATMQPINIYKAPVRGDRVRGSVHAKRQLSSKVLTRHQIKTVPSSEKDLRERAPPPTSLSVQGTPLKSAVQQQFEVVYKRAGTAVTASAALGAEDKAPFDGVAGEAEHLQSKGASAKDFKDFSDGDSVAFTPSLFSSPVVTIVAEAKTEETSSDTKNGDDSEEEEEEEEEKEEEEGADAKGSPSPDYRFADQSGLLSTSDSSQTYEYEEDFEEEYDETFENNNDLLPRKSEENLYETGQMQGREKNKDPQSESQSSTVPRLLITPIWAIRDHTTIAPSAETARSNYNTARTVEQTRTVEQGGERSETHPITVPLSREQVTVLSTTPRRPQDTDQELEKYEDEDEDINLRRERERIQTLQNWIIDIRSTMLSTLGAPLFDSIYTIVAKNMTTNRTFLTGLEETDGFIRDIHSQLNDHLQTSLEGACRVVLQLKTLLALESEIEIQFEDYVRK